MCPFYRLRNWGSEKVFSRWHSQKYQSQDFWSWSLAEVLSPKLSLPWQWLSNLRESEKTLRSFKKKKKKYKTLTSPPDYLSEALGKSLILNHFSFLICKIREQILTFYCERSIDEAWSRKISGISRVTFGDVEVIISQIQGEIASLEGEMGVRSTELLLVFINFIDLVDSLTYMQLYKLLKI